MRKSLLIATLVASAMSASAAVEVGFMDAAKFNLGDKPTLPAMTELVATENAAMYYLNEDVASAQNCDFQGFKTVIVNGESCTLVPGIGGTTNPAAVNLMDGPATGGCKYLIKVKKNGWVIVPSKISSNKNFYVYEGLDGEGNTPVAYTLGMDLQSADYPDITQIIYTLPADADGYLNLEAANIDDFTFGGTAIAWPIKIATHNDEAVSGGNGTGVIIFPVYAEAENYEVFATGSKMNTCGYIFVEGDPAGEAPAVSLFCAGSDDRAEKTIVVTGEGGNSALGTIIADENANAPMYNIYGQRVNESYKGLVIKNGVKFIN